jgi:hypothetical protein
LLTSGAHAELPGIPDFYPPPQYDHEYAGKLYISAENPLSTLETACSMKTIGCAHVPYTHGLGANECMILLPKRETMDKMGIDYEALKRHEIAHCNGWRHTNPPTEAAPPPMEPVRKRGKE